tara:strand:- start:6587 stop:7267 length:681 start_codon:yes stop_codon:yes gene_type:complete
MKYKGILLDLDNTLYSYCDAHDYAFSKIINYINKEFKIDKITIINNYNEAKKNIQIKLKDTASSHNRLLYIQGLLEYMEINALDKALKIYDIYWDNFLSKMKLFEGVFELIKIYKGKICLVTDLTAHIQYRKIKKLNLDNYIHLVVSSEECGIEKPDASMFMLGLEKLKLSRNDICMIGDNYNKDICGASNLGIKSIWLNHEQIQQSYNKDLVIEVAYFKEILNLV